MLNMFPGGMSPAKMQGMMKKMGISQTELPVKKVIFEMNDGNLVIENPSVVKVVMQGQETYQVSGEAVKENNEIFSDEDVELVVSQTGATVENAREALEKSGGDIAEAIIGLK